MNLRSRLVPTTVAGQAAALASLGTLAALALTGLATAVLLHRQANRALDDTLLAVAAEAAHPALPLLHEWDAPGIRSPVSIRRWEGGLDPEVPIDALETAIHRERRAFLDLGGRRVLLQPAETEILGATEDEEKHLVIIATAAVPTFTETGGRLLVPFGASAALVSVLVGLAQVVGMHRALRPLALAADAAGRVTSLGAGARLPEGGPDEVRAFLGAINGLLDRLEKSFAAQARFTSEAAHELRTPVAAMRGELEVALRRPRSCDEYKSAAEGALVESRRLGALVDGLLALARVDAGGADQHREPEHAGHLAHRAAAQEKAALDRAGCRLSLDVAADPEVEVQVPLVVAALGNLLRNAARHAPGGPVRLRVEDRKPHVAFLVEDNGPGVAPAEREAIFGRFVRGAHSRANDPDGLGLGLPFTREVARRHGGDCILEATPTGGARFVLTLRRAQAAEPPSMDA